MDYSFTWEQIQAIPNYFMRKKWHRWKQSHPDELKDAQDPLQKYILISRSIDARKVASELLAEQQAKQQRISNQVSRQNSPRLRSRHFTFSPRHYHNNNNNNNNSIIGQLNGRNKKTLWSHCRSSTGFEPIHHRHNRNRSLAVQNPDYIVPTYRSSSSSKRLFNESPTSKSKSNNNNNNLIEVSIDPILDVPTDQLSAKPIDIKRLTIRVEMSKSKSSTLKEGEFIPLQAPTHKI